MASLALAEWGGGRERLCIRRVVAGHVFETIHVPGVLGILERKKVKVEGGVPETSCVVV